MLSISAKRPVFAGIETLADCTAAQPRFIAGQQSFCGMTNVDGVVCTARRLHDLLVERGTGDGWETVPSTHVWEDKGTTTLAVAL